jgi:hypothetical protein
MYIMRIAPSAALVLLGAVLCSAAAGAQTPSAQAVRAARDATAQAKAVTYRLIVRGSGVPGSVALYPIGSTRTRVVVTVPMTGLHRLTLYRASDCYDSVTRARALVALTPINNAGVNAPSSSTIVNLPIGQLSSGNYVVDVRNATSQATFAEACAHLNGGR